MTISKISKAQERIIKQDTALSTMFFNSEFKWQIVVPKGFDTVSIKAYLALQKKGIKDLEKTSNKNFQTDSFATRICAYQSDGMFNYFEANKETFDPKIDGDFFEHCKKNDDYIYIDYRKDLFSATKIDTTVSNEIIDGYTFEKFQIHIGFDKNNELNMYVYSRLFGKKEFTLVILYFNRKKGKLILDAWRNSKFGKG